ncbi:hypothetical protein H5410_040129 [Solanum commersonii]|uniref:Uncharacterized protein n=1 Tax=Solanum commersonii TaxID=4109 RepID=A0A9J5XQ33_SOLCO|nr:hypothetical protein H5410_040129 [Solanum commersonii]
MKWRLASDVLYDKKVPPKCKCKFYIVMIRLSLLYEVECCLVKNICLEDVHVAEMRHTKNNKIKNEIIHEKVGVASMADKTTKASLRWFEHVKRRCSDSPMRRCERLIVRGTQRVEIGRCGGRVLELKVSRGRVLSYLANV